MTDRDKDALAMKVLSWSYKYPVRKRYRAAYKALSLITFWREGILT